MVSDNHLRIDILAVIVVEASFEWMAQLMVVLSALDADLSSEQEEELMLKSKAALVLVWKSAMEAVSKFQLVAG